MNNWNKVLILTLEGGGKDRRVEEEGGRGAADTVRAGEEGAMSREEPEEGAEGERGEGWSGEGIGPGEVGGEDTGVEGRAGD